MVSADDYRDVMRYVTPADARALVAAHRTASAAARALAEAVTEATVGPGYPDRSAVVATVTSDGRALVVVTLTPTAIEHILDSRDRGSQPSTRSLHTEAGGSPARPDHNPGRAA